MRHETCTVVTLVAAAAPPEASPADGAPARPAAGVPRHGPPAAAGGGDLRPADPPDLVSAPVLADLDTSANISVVRPPGTERDPVDAAIAALRQAARRSSPFAVVPADPLAAVAAQWQGMWDLSRAGVTGPALFEEQVARALAAWRTRQFELPDYYLVLADTVRPGGSAGGPDFYLGPLHAARSHRVVVVAATGGPEQAAAIRDALRTLRQGPWWPPLDEVLDTARRFFAGGLAEASSSLARS